MIKYGLLLELKSSKQQGDEVDPIKKFLNNYGKKTNSSQKVYLVPSVLPDDLKAYKSDSSLGKYQDCYFGFYFFNPNKAFQRKDLKSISFLPNGLFDRLLCRLIGLCMSDLCLADLSSSISRKGLILSYEGQFFELLYDRSHNILRLKVNEMNPIPVYLMILNEVQQILAESFDSLNCMTLLTLPSSTNLLWKIPGFFDYLTSRNV